MDSLQDSYLCRAESGWDGIYIIKHRIVKKTAKGVWIDCLGAEKFVLLGARKAYAYPTEQEAVTSLVARKKCWVKILTARLQQAEHQLKVALKGEISAVHLNGI